MVTTADQLASSAGLSMLEHGGTAADAMVAAAAVMAVVGPHLCGLGGDALAMVKAPTGHPPRPSSPWGGRGRVPIRIACAPRDTPTCRCAVTSGASPFRARSTDGWRFTSATDASRGPRCSNRPSRSADDGFAASLLAGLRDPSRRRSFPALSQLCPDGPLEPGQVVRLPGIARTLRNLASDGTRRLLRRRVRPSPPRARAMGSISADDLAQPLAQWADPLVLRASATTCGRSRPRPRAISRWPGRGSRTRSASRPTPSDPLWPHLMAEAGRAASFDRPSVLYDGADGAALLSPERLGPRASVHRP